MKIVLPSEEMPHKMSESMRWLGICMLYEDWEFHLPKETGLTGPVMSAVLNYPFEGHPYRRPKAWRHRLYLQFREKRSRRAED